MDAALSALHGGSLPCGRHLLAPLTGNNKKSKGLMVLRAWTNITHRWTAQTLICLNSSVSLSVGLSIHDKVMDVARSELQKAKDSVWCFQGKCLD